jgi:hypothetical protein
MASARAIFQAHVDGLLPESLPFDLQWTLPTATGVIRVFDLNAGDNQITPPAGTTLVAYKPPPTSTATLKVKGAPTDTGVTLQATYAIVLSLAGSPFYLNASVAVAGGVLFFA